MGVVHRHWQTFNGLYIATFRLSTEHQARTDQLTVDRYAASTAIASAAAFFGANQAQSVTQHIQHRFTTLANIFNGVAVYCG